MDSQRREESRREYLRRRVEKKIHSLEEEIEYKRVIEEEDTADLERVLMAVKPDGHVAISDNGDDDDDYEMLQLKRNRQSVKKFRTFTADTQTNTKCLPIHEHEREIINMIRDNQVSIVVAETGSGKTTQLPQMLYRNGLLVDAEGNRRKLVCTQPRRVAAMSVAERVSQELMSAVGGNNKPTRRLRDGLVGYSVRFDDQCGESTVIKFVTDGVLLREFVAQPDLQDYAVVIIDEAHERTVATDILLGLLKDLCRFRADLRLVISSATMNAQRFAAFYNDAPVYCVPGRLFPVTRQFLVSPEPDYVYAAVQCCLDICQRVNIASTLSSDCNDILVFMTGQEEIDVTVRVLREKAEHHNLPMIVFPLYAALPANQQQLIFKPTPLNCIKVVVATNIAETSLTVDGIVHVIDCGMVKQTAFNPRTGIDSLVVTAVSRASAEQRAGRAGRTRPGHCYRLYTRACFDTEMASETVPEMQRSNLAAVCLFMKSLGIDDLLQFDFIDAPPPDLMTRSIADLYRLGALDHGSGELTQIGLYMAELPVDPPLARVLIEAAKVGRECAESVCRIAGMLSTEMTLFYRNDPVKDTAKDKKEVNVFAHPKGDHFMLLRVFEEWNRSGKLEKWCVGAKVNPAALLQADNIRRQLLSILERMNIITDIDKPSTEEATEEDIKAAFMAGYASNIAVIDRTGLSYTIAGGRTAHLHPSSCLSAGKPPKKILFHDLITTSKDFMRTAMVIAHNFRLKLQWLSSAPHTTDYLKVRQIYTHTHNKPRIVNSIETFYGAIESTADALRVFELCRQGKLGRVRRRLHDAERRLIRSGSVFVFDEAESGIRRWTDGRLWSPSRIHGNFLVYRELEKRQVMVDSGTGTEMVEEEDWLPDIENIDPRLLDANTITTNDPQQQRDEVGLSESLLEKKNRTLLNSQRPNQARYVFKRDGMVKRTISARVDGHWQHLVCYYSRHHFCTVVTGGPAVDALFDAGLMAELRAVRVPIDLVVAQNFRRPPLLTTAVGHKEVPLTQTVAPRPRRDSASSTSSSGSVQVATSNTPIPILTTTGNTNTSTSDDDLIISECVDRVTAILNQRDPLPVSRYSLILDQRVDADGGGGVEDDGDGDRWFLRGDPSMPLME